MRGAPWLLLVVTTLAACAMPARHSRHSRPVAAVAPGAGGGVAIYVFDGGIADSVTALPGRVRHGFTAYPGDVPVCNDHGAAVATALAGTTRDAASVEIVDVKVIDCWRQRGSVEAVLHATRWVIADARRHPGRRAVANWSFAASLVPSDGALAGAIAELTRAGIPVVVSAGNREIAACRIAPANVAAAITVGALASGANTPAPGTARGPCVDVYAPGAAGAWSGTSISAAYVSGAVALYLDQHPAADVHEVAAFVAARRDVATAGHLEVD